MKTLERHPFPPFTPQGAKVLIMGTFPPKPLRWSMEFYYPNKTNDFWRIMGLIFYGDKDHFRDAGTGAFRQADIEAFLVANGIALHDTGAVVHRLKDNAADKFLEIVEPVDLGSLLRLMPDCHYIATTGEKAAGVIAGLTSSPLPGIGEFVDTRWEREFTGSNQSPVTPDGRTLHITRMPSTSRAYPLALEKKAESYRRLFIAAGILPD